MKTRRNIRKRSYQKNISSSSDSNSDFEESEGIHSKKLDKQQFYKVRQEIKRTEPNIILFMNEPLLLEDKAKLLQLYEIYKSSDINTENWLCLRDTINKTFEESKNNYSYYNKYTKKEHEEINKQLSLINNNYSTKQDTDFKYKIIKLNTTTENKKIIFNKYKEYCEMSFSDDEKAKLKSWLNWSISIPYDSLKIFSYEQDNLTKFLKQLSACLDKELYGMKTVKEQILLFVSSKIQNPHMKKCSLGLIGSPGVGKTFISRLLAKLLNFPFEQICFGGVSNPDFLKGHDYTYVGSQPGEIVKCLRRMKYKNGILFFDEFDKVSSNPDICSSLLHITDPIQNSDFKDNFLSELRIDLSHIWFIYSMNELPTNNALRDRIYIVKVSSYTREDKIHIMLDYLFPRALKNINNSYTKDYIKISEKVATYLVEKIPNEEDGVRTLEKMVNDIITKIEFIIKHQDKNGNLDGFNISFKLSKHIKYPVELTFEMVDIFLKTFHI